MEANLKFKNIERRIKELAKEYESKGYSVITRPNRFELPEFLAGFEPDLIAKNNSESVVIEVKSREDISDLKRYENFASEISKRDGWRFELVFTNTLSPFIDKSADTSLSKDDIKNRIQQIRLMTNNDFLDAAFLLGWATIEAAMRNQLENEKITLSSKPTSYIFKTLYSYGLINQHDYKNLEKLFSLRNNLIHGFYQPIDRTNINDIVSITEYLIGESIETVMQDWLEMLDLHYYDDIHSLYMTAHEKENYGAFCYEESNGKIIISADDFDDELILESDEQRKVFVDLIEEEYMDDMSPDGWYAYHRAMEKND